MSAVHPPFARMLVEREGRRAQWEDEIMWDTVAEPELHLSHDMECVACGHAGHTVLPCSDTCDCRPPSHLWRTAS